MSKFSRLIVLVVGLMSVFAAMAGAAGASTWHNTGGNAFTASGGAGTLSVTGRATLVCTGSTATGTAGTSSAGPTWTGAITGGVVTFSGCVLGGVPTTVRCNYSLNATTYTPGTDTVSGDAVIPTGATGTVPNGCDVRQGGVTICGIDGVITGGTYANATGVLTIPANSQLTLRDNTSRAGSCPFGAGSRGTLTSLRFTVTSTPRPNIRQP
jgi:hypothetical protein